MFSVNEFKNNKWTGQWLVETLEEAKTTIDAIKITRVGNTYNIEHPDGYVIDVYKF